METTPRSDQFELETDEDTPNTSEQSRFLLTWLADVPQLNFDVSKVNLSVDDRGGIMCVNLKPEQARELAEWILETVPATRSGEGS